VDEFAVLCSQGDATQAPILQQVIEQHGRDSLSEMFHALRDPGPTYKFLEYWLFSDPSQEGANLSTLQDIGHQAVQTGRDDSLALISLVLFGDGTEWAALPGLVVDLYLRGFRSTVAP
jgi:hypothetical protein